MATEAVEISQERVNERVEEILQKLIQKGYLTKEKLQHFLENKKEALPNDFMKIMIFDLSLFSYVAPRSAGSISASDEEISEAIKAFCAK